MHASVLDGFGIPGDRVLGWVSTAMATATDSGLILGFGNYILGCPISRRLLKGGLCICQRRE